MKQPLQQTGQRAGQISLQPAHVGVRLDPGKSSLSANATAGVAHQHAPQAKPAGVLIAASTQSQLNPVCLAQAPSNSGASHPLRESGQRVGGNAKTCGNRGHLQQVAHLAQAHPLRGQTQQPRQRVDQRAAGACAQVGNVKRNMARIMPAILTKHSPDGRGQRVDVGHHDHHVTRLQWTVSRGIGKQLEQLIVQNFNFALGAVGDVENNGPVGRQRSHRRMLVQRQQIADAVLYLRQQGRIGCLGVVEQVDARYRKTGLTCLCVIKLVKLAHEIPALTAPGRQQRMGVGVHLVKRQCRQIAALAQWLSSAFHAQQLPSIHDVGPVKPAGVGNGQQHLAVARQRCQHLQCGQRQVAHAKQHHPACHWRCNWRA